MAGAFDGFDPRPHNVGPQAADLTIYMALRSFRVENKKAISLAECSAVPRIMVVAGPNGVGKSTMLYELSQKRGATFEGATTVLYQPPHRAVRASQVMRRNTFSGAASFGELLSKTEVSGYEGLNFNMPGRTPDNVDEAGSTIKHSFAKLENRFQTALSDRILREKKQSASHLALDEIPDIYQPLRTFTDFLLPHLHFKKVDVSADSNVKCLWERVDRRAVIELDIDQLSSGEKALIMMFLPTIESEIEALLHKIEPPAVVAPKQDLLVIIDEPEQHIHPDLQARVMAYLRKVATARKIQFIVSTHSPTILDQAWDDELFVMIAADDDPTENQLKKVATNLERLEALRELAGSTFALTTGRSIICIEGQNTEPAEPSDVRILEVVCPRATAYTFVPVGSKSSVINTVNQLRANLPVQDFKVNVFGVTDQDRGGTPIAGIASLPVCMIENLLLQPAAIATAAQALNATVTGIEAVHAQLAEAVRIQRDEEIALRVSNRLKPSTIRPKGASRGSVVASIREQLQPYQQLLDDPTPIQQAIETATAEVDELIAKGLAEQAFRGKKIIRRVFTGLFPNGAVSYSEFVHHVAVEVAKDENTQQLLNAMFDGLEQSVGTH